MVLDPKFEGLRNSTEPQLAEKCAMKKNTLLCIDLKTHLMDDTLLKVGKNYNGVLRHDPMEEYGEDHYTFTETCNSSTSKHNPHAFEGRYINVSMRPDGSLQPHFREMLVDKDFTVNRYAAGVAKELRKALGCLVEESE